MPSARDINLGLCPPPEIAFPDSEFRQRHRRIRERMMEQGFDVLYLTAPESRYYVDGYNSDWYQAQSPADWHALSGVAIHVDHDKVITFEREVNVVLVNMTTLGDDTRILRGETTMAEFIARELEREGWLGGNVGIERYSYRPNPVVSDLLSASLTEKGCQVKDCSHILREVRSIKSALELSYVRKAAAIGDAGMRAALATIGAGVTELDVYVEIVSAMIKAGGEDPAKTVSCASGLRTLCTDAQTTHRKIVPGDIVNVDLCGCYQRYHTNYARTFSVGEPLREVAERMESAAGAFDVLKGVIQPGIRVDEMTAAVKNYLVEAGIWDDRWWVGGYEMGIAFAPDWVGPFVYDPDVEAGERRFESGTVVNIECDFFLPKMAGLSLIIDTLIFDDDSASLAHSVPQSLLVV